MNDTLPEIAERQRARHRAMTGSERLLAAARMYDAAREMVLASLPPDLPEPERRYRLFIRIYGAQFEAQARKAFLEKRGG